MIRTSEVNAESNIETTVKCVACGHICKEVYIVKDGKIIYSGVPSEYLYDGDFETEEGVD